MKNLLRVAELQHMLKKVNSIGISPNPQRVVSKDGFRVNFICAKWTDGEEVKYCWQLDDNNVTIVHDIFIEW